MASEEAQVVVTEEQQPEQAEAIQGREQVRARPKRGKSKARTPPMDPVEQKLIALEQSLSPQEAIVGELSEQIDNIVQENEKITQAAKGMITELGRALQEELQALIGRMTEV
ncbi:hypothetical protein JCGZ_13826 [Jatropha curcas]|uniref:Uncharacterized protein n=1 Tax=Jatropha curcas TaxID=180498 RepID=A0A067KKA7_JATCU|nr:hypothetical protein JCGZ_13826 [Jatropha curcas]